MFEEYSHIRTIGDLCDHFSVDPAIGYWVQLVFTIVGMGITGITGVWGSGKLLVAMARKVLPKGDPLMKEIYAALKNKFYSNVQELSGMWWYSANGVDFCVLNRHASHKDDNLVSVVSQGKEIINDLSKQERENINYYTVHAIARVLERDRQVRRQSLVNSMQYGKSNA